ncbi:MAG: glycogen/starch/alpha-glucan phosphorylase [Acidobacteriota bacterium]
MKNSTAAGSNRNPGTFSSRLNMTANNLKKVFEHHLRYTLAKDSYTATERDYYFALSLAIRDFLVERWLATQQTHHRQNVKRAYYLSLEFLIGRLLGNNAINLKIEDLCVKAMQKEGLDWQRIRDYENDAGLGNGGLGRLAACFLDSLSTHKYPAFGYGLRYNYGIFHQHIVNGYQVEEPDAWLKHGYPWDIAHPEFSFTVGYGGQVVTEVQNGRTCWKWIPGKSVIGMPYDLPIVGYGGEVVNTLRLWSARAREEFDLEDFNRGSYIEAVENKVLAENLTKVLYPNDNIFEGKELRLKQEYFFVSCSIQDIIRRFKEGKNRWDEFPDYVAIQLNDTHPALAIPELMRLLMDTEGLGWDEAWDLTVSSTGYTNHTILSEALERWPLNMLAGLLPRHIQIIQEINGRFLRTVANRYPMDLNRLRRMSIIEEGKQQYIRMANLAVIGSHSVNGVAQLHTQLLRSSLLKDFAEFWPEKFNNKTNGITQRRWLMKANPGLAALITEAIGEQWITDLERLHELEPLAGDAGFRERFRAVKQQNKADLAEYIHQSMQVSIDPASMFDVQVKRLHEYKRQLLLALYIIQIYNRIKDNPDADVVPRTFIFGGKAAPGYATAKLIIKLINQVAEVINNDPQISQKMRVLFVPNYRVSLAERIIPAANLSEQISLAGTEASGTGNMKFQLNGALTIGTLDGANIEILEEVGSENIFIFGMKAEEVSKRRKEYNPFAIYNGSEEIRRVLQMIEQDFFSMLEPGIFRPLVDTLLKGGDPYMVLADLYSYAEVQDQTEALYRNPALWDEKAIINVARSGKFSSDRTIKEYARDIWGIVPHSVDGNNRSDPHV